MLCSYTIEKEFSDRFHGKITKRYEIKSNQPEHTLPSNLCPSPSSYKTLSGRNTKLMHNYNDTIIHSVEYENELDLLVVTIEGVVFIYDNSDGKLVKKFPLKFWPKKAESRWVHNVILDRDTLVHLSSLSDSQKCVCNIYKLSRETE
jgi:hypothetical protein